MTQTRRPKFLTKEIARVAIEAAITATTGNPAINTLFKRHVCHIVILVPEVTTGADWTKSITSAHCLYEHSVGNPSDWQFSFDEIARSKAMQLWQGRNDGTAETQYHLLTSGDTPYFGGVVRQGVVVCCSGVQPHFDRMLSGIVADILIGLAYEAWLTSEDCDDSVAFLG